MSNRTAFERLLTACWFESGPGSQIWPLAIPPAVFPIWWVSVVSANGLHEQFETRKLRSPRFVGFLSFEALETSRGPCEFEKPRPLIQPNPTAGDQEIHGGQSRKSRLITARNTALRESGPWSTHVTCSREGPLSGSDCGTSPKKRKVCCRLNYRGSSIESGFQRRPDRSGH